MAHCLLGHVYPPPLNLNWTHVADQRPWVLRATWMETVAESPSRATARLLPAGVPSGGDPRSPASTKYKIQTPSHPQPGEHVRRQRNALPVNCQEAISQPARASLAQKPQGKSLLSLQVPQPGSPAARGGSANSGREASSRGAGSGPGPLLRAESLRFGALQQRRPQRSLLAAEGRGRSWEQS